MYTVNALGVVVIVVIVCLLFFGGVALVMAILCTIFIRKRYLHPDRGFWQAWIYIYILIPQCKRNHQEQGNTLFY